MHRGEILVRVHSSALNRADLSQRMGRYPAPPGVPADIPGIEFAGEVAGRGTGAERWRDGDRVFGIVSGVYPAWRSSRLTPSHALHG